MFKKDRFSSDEPTGTASESASRGVTGAPFVLNETPSFLKRRGVLVVSVIVVAVLVAVTTFIVAWFYSDGDKNEIVGSGEEANQALTTVLASAFPLSHERNSLFYADPDQDGLNSNIEAVLGTDPNVADTDNDGYGDGEEIIAGYDPLGPEKRKVGSDAIIKLAPEVSVTPTPLASKTPVFQPSASKPSLSTNNFEEGVFYETSAFIDYPCFANESIVWKEPDSVKVKKAGQEEPSVLALFAGQINSLACSDSQIVYATVDGHIYNYNLLSGQEERISSGLCRNPDVHGNIAAWSCYNGITWDVNIYDIATGASVAKLATEVEVKSWAPRTKVNQQMVVWRENTSASDKLAVYSLGEQRKIVYTDNLPQPFINPVPAGLHEIAVSVRRGDKTSSPYDLYIFDLNEEKLSRITANSDNVMENPVVSTRYLIWTNKVDWNNQDLYYYDRKKGKTGPIANSTGYVEREADFIDEDLIVYKKSKYDDQQIIIKQLP